MTLADRQNPPARTQAERAFPDVYRSRILRSMGRRGPEGAEAGGVQRKMPAMPFVPEDHKHLSDLADLLNMSSLDPQPFAGGVDAGDAPPDLLNQLVDAHLDAPPPVSAPAPAASALESEAAAGAVLEMRAAGPDLSDDARVQLLQTEIDTLLKGHAGGGGAAAPAVEGDGPVGHGADPGALSHGELELLTGGGAGLPAAALAEPRIEEDPALTEAEGVLAAELAQLMAETEGEGASAGGAGGGAGGAAAAAAAAEMMPAAETPSAGVVIEPAETPAAAERAGAVVEAAPAAEAAAVSEARRATPAEISAADETAAQPEGAGEAVKSAGASSFLARQGQVAADVCLMVFQLIDAPFAWISDLDKNAIGFAAFLLLCSGVLLFVLASIYK